MSVLLIDEISSKTVNATAIVCVNAKPTYFIPGAVGVQAAPYVLAPATASAAGGSGAVTLTVGPDALAESVGVQYFLTAQPAVVSYKQFVGKGLTTVVVTVPAGAYTFQARSEAGYGSVKGGGGIFSAWSAGVVGTAS